MKHLPTVLLTALCLTILLHPTNRCNYKHLLSVSCKVVIPSGGSGSGVYVTRLVGRTSRTFVWTAGHVAEAVQREDGTFGDLEIEDGEVKGVPAKVIAYSAKEDLALLEISGNTHNFPSATFYGSDEEITPGTELVHVGSVRGLRNSVSTGVMSRVNHKFDGESEVFDQTSTLGYPGSSGGGVFLRDGQCIGLLTRGVGPGLNFIVPVRRMRAWARSEGIEWAIDPMLPIPVNVKRPIDEK